MEPYTGRRKFLRPVNFYRVDREIDHIWEIGRNRQAVSLYYLHRKEACTMKIEVRVEEGCTEPKLIILGLMGSGFAMASLIWKVEHWSLARQTGLYFAAVCGLMLPIAYVSNWMEHSVGGILSYCGIFLGIFAIVWVSQYLVWRGRIRRINDKIRKGNAG